MIHISPTVDSGLSYSDYNIKLPGNVYPIRPRGTQTQIALDGSAIVQSWSKDNTGATASQVMNLDISDFILLNDMIKQSAEWIVSSMGRKFKGVVDISAVESVEISGVQKTKCTVTFVVVTDQVGE